MNVKGVFTLCKYDVIVYFDLRFDDRKVLPRGYAKGEIINLEVRFESSLIEGA